MLNNRFRVYFATVNASSTLFSLHASAIEKFYSILRETAPCFVHISMMLNIALVGSDIGADAGQTDRSEANNLLAAFLTFTSIAIRDTRSKIIESTYFVLGIPS